MQIIESLDPGQPLSIQSSVLSGGGFASTTDHTMRHDFGTRACYSLTRFNNKKRDVKRYLLSVFLVVLCWVPAAADEYPVNPAIDVLHYTFSLQLGDASDEIIGEAAVTVSFSADTITTFTLDLVGKRPGRSQTGMTVNRVLSGDQEVPFEHRDDRLQVKLEAPAEPGEERTFLISYRGIPADGLIISTNKYGERTFFGDNWPNRARHWLPTIDHPSDKATVEFVIQAPDHYEVVSNGELVEEKDLPGPLTLTHWRATAPLPTKVMVIGVADFAIEVAGEHDGIPVQSWVYPADSLRGFFDFAVAQRILGFFDDRIGPYPYEKLANVQSTTKYGGMENAGAIFYHEDAITGTRNNERLLAHEIAHQWFGDGVTERDWHHIWLSEGFATYFAELYTEAIYGRDRMLQFMRDAREKVFAYERQAPDSPLVDTTIVDLNQLLNPNSYQKGAWVLHMLRYVVGDEVFWDGIQQYYEKYRNGNALTEDFQQEMEAVYGEDLSWFFQQWVYRPGHPIFDGTWHYDATGGKLEIHLRQVQRGETTFIVPIEVAIKTGESSYSRLETLQVTARNQTFTLEADGAPTDIVLDPQDWLLIEADLDRR